MNSNDISKELLNILNDTEKISEILIKDKEKKNVKKDEKAKKHKNIGEEKRIKR